MLKDRKGIVSSLYEPRANIFNDDLKVLLAHMQDTPTNICATKLINSSPVNFRQTQFGNVPSGSFLSYQCPLMPPDFNIYCSLKPSTSENTDGILFKQYPSFPFHQVQNSIDEFTKELHIIEIKKIAKLQELKTHSEAAVSIEASTRNQADDPEWFSYRKSRFTASLCNKFGTYGPKTEKGLKTLAHNIVTGSKKIHNVAKMKMEYGRFYEPIAIQHYERYMRLSGFNIMVEQCGLVIDKVNYVLGATPDGKVCCDGSFGILEVKCSEQYKDIDPKSICHISPNPCIVINKENGHIDINKNHSYYDQIQMQLAVTCRTWCDFVLYTSKGLVIDRVEFDEFYWESLQRNILEFYFKYMLPEIVESDKETI